MNRIVKSGILLVYLLCGLFVSPLAAAELSVKNGNLSCEPLDCSVALAEDQSFRVHDAIAHVAVTEIDGTEVYYFLSTDIVDIPAYSGKPIVVLIGMDATGVLVDARLVKHSEPILLVGIPEQKLVDFIDVYKGWDIRTKISLGDDASADLSIDIITGATVTVLVTHQTIETAARKIATQVGILSGKQASTAVMTTEATVMSWQELLDIGAIGHLQVEPAAMGAAGDEPWIDLYFADVQHPSVGISLLGESTWEWLMGEVSADGSAIVMLSNGAWSFKGSGFARGGIYDRFHIEQGLNSFTFRDLDYENLYGLEAEGAPEFEVTGLFKVDNPIYDPSAPWEMVIVSSRLTGETATSKVFKDFRAEYQLPGQYFVRQLSMLEQIWVNKKLAVAWYITLWVAVIVLFLRRRQLSDDARVLKWVHNAVLAVCLITIGLVQRGQPSVVNILTLLDVVRHQGSFGIFFTDPFLAIGWIFIVITLVLWGRPFFCGWICPFGAMQALLFELRVALTPWKSNYQFPAKVHRALKPLRYVLLFVLVGISLYSLQTAELLAEIEPFKTTWNVGFWNRPPAFGIYLAVLLAAGIVMERFYCRYICPLGAALSLGSFFTFLPLPRRNYCTKCVKCAKGCSTLAIDEDGAIDAKECLGCMECLNTMYDKEACPPLVSIKTWNKYEADDPKAPPKT